MNYILPRLSIRLLVPALAITALFALGEPIQSQAAMIEADPVELHVTGGDAGDLVVIAIRAEMEALNAEALAAKTAAHQTASRMRWAMTLPAASAIKRCLVDTCSG
jgi:hypothetical protein